jgi:feruloyl esterase
MAAVPARGEVVSICADLAKWSLAPEAIGLPSKGASISSVEFVPAAPTMAAAAPPPAANYCKIRGAIAPVDPSTPPINFEVNLPAAWNAKSVQYGGGGFNGVLITGLDPLRDAPPTVATPLALGYATIGTDSGHQNKPGIDIQAFALNDEALENFSFAAYKKVHDTAMALMKAYYGRPPTRSYFFGGSEGGREGLTMVQRFPADFDGVVSAVPVINWVGLQTAGNRGGIMQQNGGWLNPAKVTMLRKAVLAACDKLDGLEEGVVSDVAACAKTFDAANLRCAGGSDTGDDCLSDPQIKAFKTIHEPFTFDFALANGVTSYPGWGYGGEDQPDGVVQWITGPRPAAFPLPSPSEQGRQWYYGSGAIRYFIARDANFNSLNFDPNQFKDRVIVVSALMDSTNPDISAFLARGGKLIIKENTADYAQSPYAGINYYKSVVAKLGQDTADKFIRLYTATGVNHGGAGVNGKDGRPLPRSVDMLTLLDGWVEKGAAPPDAVTLTDHATAPPFAVTASRLMCRYPGVPRGKPGGDPAKADDYVCGVD